MLRAKHCVDGRLSVTVDTSCVTQKVLHESAWPRPGL